MRISIGLSDGSMISTLRVLTVGSKRKHIHGLLACCCVAAKRCKATSLTTEGSAGDKNVLRYRKERTLRRWYREVVERGGLARAHDLPGCFIMLPSSMYIWDTIRERVTIELGRVGVKPCCFPLFVPSRPVPSAVSSAECLPGLVTKAGGSTLNEPVALRISSDEVAEACLSEWIRSHRDLPLKLSHWGSSMKFNSRWRHLPLLKCREVLQQEGYAAHKSLDEAEAFAGSLIELYRNVFKDLLALSTEEGTSEDGATRLLDALISDGCRVRVLTVVCKRAVENVQFEDSDGVRKGAHLVTWSIDFGVIGAMVMVHGDDRGLVIPPNVAETQAVVIPMPPSRDVGPAQWEVKMRAIERRCEEVRDVLLSDGIRCIFDDDTRKKRPGFKFTRWDLQGVPLSIQLGCDELESKTLTIGYRHSGQKFNREALSIDRIRCHLGRIATEMLSSARRHHRDAA